MNEIVIFEPFRTIPLKKFHPELRFEFNDAPDQLFDFALIRTARQMARDGNLIRRRAKLNLHAHIFNYKLRSPDGLEVCNILGHHTDAGCCHHTARSFTPPDDCLPCHQMVVWYDDIEEELRVEPSADATLWLELSVMPADDACELPAPYYDKYVSILIAGAKARILQQGGKPWTNYQLAVIYERAYKSQLADAVVDLATHKQRGAVKMNFGRIL